MSMEKGKWIIKLKTFLLTQGLPLIPSEKKWRKENNVSLRVLLIAF